MEDIKLKTYLQAVLENMPNDWLSLTTHRLDIYREHLAKVEFLDELNKLFEANITSTSALANLPTAYDYIRLGHPLSCIVEWYLANTFELNPNHVISFSSSTIPMLAVLRKNALDKKKTRIIFSETLPNRFDEAVVRQIYGYNFELICTKDVDSLPAFDGTTLLVCHHNEGIKSIPSHIDFLLCIYDHLGSIILANVGQNQDYISAIQHVRRRESIAMTPANCQIILRALLNGSDIGHQKNHELTKTTEVLNTIKDITNTPSKPLISSSGLSIQYAILMGLIHHAKDTYPEKPIKIIVPPNCYGGTNDQARRVAAAVENVEVVDLPVDGNDDMASSTESVLKQMANLDAVPLIIAEIPTNPRVEVPDLHQLNAALTKDRQTPSDHLAVKPIFILDQTFCPNVQFVNQGEILEEVKTISFSSGSKFPSGGLCTAGYCVGNKNTEDLLSKIELHLQLCDNEATHHQVEILHKQLPSMLSRINAAYKNTRAFVSYINELLPEAKINFVSESLAAQGFTPSVFSLDLPTKGNSDAERETYKRALNLKLINRMIKEIPNESKFCVSYGQLKGCYWTVPATSTQGTTKEGDKDYIVRASLSPDLDLEMHKKVFADFVKTL